MTHRWNQTILIDEALAGNLVESQFDLSVESIKNSSKPTVMLIKTPWIFVY
jgi:chaperone required for assembly of F1-ATPase